MTDQEAFNMSMRKFLKQVGVTSQSAIEAALRDGKLAGNSKMSVKMVLSDDSGALNHVVTGEIQLPDGDTSAGA